ncbi:uncharacterized protein LOC143353654 isoform X2 [Halictus rubicundus]|uniref:uncharacterized protein LOC143353654 isoform X2 n=1 Tax=Halictus rubicundus TaxID=77578 RepID=UPI0040358CC7
MGAAGSSNGAPPPPTTPLRSQSEETFTYGTEESCCPEYTNENIRQRTRTSEFDVGEEPRSQGPSPYTTLRGEEWWSQRPSAPTLSNLRSGHRETLLTYAQMTGWQTAERHGPSFAQHHEQAMEFSRAISQLAMANQQLASAHTTTLAHLEELYKELRKGQEYRRRGSSLDEAASKRLTERTNDHEERQRLELRIDRLENLLAEEWDGPQGRQRSLRQEEGKRLRSRIDRVELKPPGPEDDRQERESFCSTENPDSRMDQRTDDIDTVQDRVSTIDLPERQVKCQHTVDAMADGYRTSSIHRVCTDAATCDSRSDDETDRPRVSRHLENHESRMKDEEAQTESSEVNKLMEEIERLKAEQLEDRSTNNRLASELDGQKALVAKLTKDYETSQSSSEELECSLRDLREEYDALMAKFAMATNETKRLFDEISAFNAEKVTAEARISGLEQDLQKSLMEREQIKSIESQKTSKLKAQLSEEVSDKKKQIKALEDALDEIQRLKDTIKTEKKGDDDDASKEDIDPIDTMANSQVSPPADRATNIEEFKKELTLKREARQRAIAAVSSEMERLRRELDAEKEAHSETSRVLDLLRSAQNDSQTQAQGGKADGSIRRSRFRDPKPDEQELAMKRIEAQRLTYILKVSDELRNDVRFQIEKVDDLRYHLETEPDQHRYRIRCLTDLTNNTRENVHDRERCANELKDHLAQILVRLGDKSFLELKDDVGLECERQLENINSLKSLYNERLKVLTELKDAAIRELADVKDRLNHSLKKSECLEEDLRIADEKNDAQDTEISNLESQLGLTKADCRDLQNQMSLINGLFTQILLGASSADMDLDRLTQLLQENHDLISDIAREESTEAAALPKLLLDLVEQVEGSKGSQKRVDGENGVENETEKKDEDLQQEEIAHNLPKVWRVLLELLRCHAEGAQTVSAAASSDPNSCYKSVDTPAGPRLVISVSKTYIRLKELILEKKHLEKEMNRMKQLNSHLESKLGEQEKRLSAVSAELSKTWTIVDRMQAQHQQLHTHERILRYELQQKRKMLQELKQELEYCREKWESARQKNTNTELEWRSLRREFAARKALAVHDSFNNSAESGFSDERGDDTDEEEDNSVEERIRLGPRRRPRKESPRVPSPDTESEQPTDTELSEPKTSSSPTLEQRTPSPETETELGEAEVAETVLDYVSEDVKEVSELISENSQEPLDSLDQALTNVIQNLIEINESSTSPPDFENFIGEPIIDEIVANNQSPENFTTNNPMVERCSLDAQCPETLQTADDILDECLEENVCEDEELLPVVPDDSARSAEVDVFGAPMSDTDMFSSSFDSSASISSSLRQESGSKSLEKRGARSTESVLDSDSVSVDSSSSLETVKEFPVVEPAPAISSVEAEKRESSETPRKEDTKPATPKTRTPEEALAAREDRLKRLEEQAKWLMNKMNATSRRGSALSTRLEELHEVYGEPPIPPPMPDVLPSQRLRTNLADLPRQIRLQDKMVAHVRFHSLFKLCVRKYTGWST